LYFIVKQDKSSSIAHAIQWWNDSGFTNIVFQCVNLHLSLMAVQLLIPLHRK
jgi:hypothetical protein